LVALKLTVNLPQYILNRKKPLVLPFYFLFCVPLSHSIWTPHFDIHQLSRWFP